MDTQGGCSESSQSRAVTTLSSFCVRARHNTSSSPLQVKQTLAMKKLWNSTSLPLHVTLKKKISITLEFVIEHVKNNLFSKVIFNHFVCSSTGIRTARERDPF